MATNFKVTGLKTGSTSLAKYCLSATAEKDGVRLIASIMAAPDFKARFADAQTLLNYGYANCKLYEDKEGITLPEISVEGGIKSGAELVLNGTFRYLSLKGEDLICGKEACSLRVPSGSGGAGPEGWGAGISVKRREDRRDGCSDRRGGAGGAVWRLSEMDDKNMEA